MDAMITCDAIDILCDHLFHESVEVRFTCAVALGYLTFNRTASRLLLHNCRNVPHLFTALMSQLNGPKSRISKQFVESFQTALALGLPKLLVRHNRVKFHNPTTTTPMSARRRDDYENQHQQPAFVGFYNSKNNADKEEMMSRANTPFLSKSKNPSLFNRSQSAPMVAKMKRTEVQTEETSTIKSVRPKMTARPYTQLAIKRNKI